MSAALQQVLQHPGIWRGNDLSRVELPSVPTGFPRLDAELPGGGWPRGALTEITFEGEGIGELSLLTPALAALSRDELWIVLVDPPHLPYAPALARAGVELSRLVLVRGGTQTPWAAETALRSGSCAAVLAWPGTVNERELRKLQLAAEAGGSWGVYFLPASASPSTSPAALRLHLAPVKPGAPVREAAGGSEPLVSAQDRLARETAGTDEAIRVHIVKRRGGPAAPFALSLQRFR
ncbi:MAG TPA: translesion DNA synthesis-associated protein ImuA [Burkholderiales bacterium]